MENNRRGACQIAWPRKPHLCARGSCVAAHFADDGVYVAVRQRGRALA